MKRFLIVIVVIIAFIFFVSCDIVLDVKGTINEQEKQYEIFQLAQEAGYIGTYEEWLESIKGDKGDKGEIGNGISSIEKTATEGLVDTYTITFTDGTTTTFTVTNGTNGEQGIQGVPGKDGYTPVITIEDGYWYVDSKNTGIKAEASSGIDGVGILSIDKTSTDGIIDTYTITLTNGSTHSFAVTNGSNGDDGLSAYEIYCKYYDYSKTEKEWIDDLINGYLSNHQKSNKKLTIAVYGDSISTKQNRNAVEITITSKDVGVKLSAYPTYHDIGTIINGYKISEKDIGTEFFFTPTASDVGKTLGNVANYNPSSITTWWEHVEEYYDCNINPVCWSSSSYSSHENSTLRLTNSYAWHDSQIRKLGTRIEGTNERIAPDIVIMYRGCNDMTHSPYTKLTSNYFDDPEWKYPETDVVDGGWGYKEALALTIKKIREVYPNTKIVLATQANFRRIDSDNFPTNNNIYSLPAFNKATREVADFFGCHTIDFDKCGITYENCYSEGYLGDTLTTATHPTNKGHKVMGEQAIYDLMYKLHITPYIAKPVEENKLYENTAVNHIGGNLYERDEYFSYDYIPVKEGTTYYMPNCRNTALLDNEGNVISIIYGPTMEANGFILSIPKGVKYIRTCARYDTVSIDEFKIIEQVQKFIIYENRAINLDGSYFDTNDYFAVDLISVKENVKYYMPNCRNTVFLDINGNFISAIYGPSMEANGFYVTVPKGAVYVRTCARYDTISVDDFKVIEIIN